MKKPEIFGMSIEEFKKQASSNITVVNDDELVDHDIDNDPEYRKMLEDAKEFLRKHPLPKSFTRSTKKAKR